MAYPNPYGMSPYGAPAPYGAPPMMGAPMMAPPMMGAPMMAPPMGMGMPVGGYGSIPPQFWYGKKGLKNAFSAQKKYNKYMMMQRMMGGGMMAPMPGMY